MAKNATKSAGTSSPDKASKKSLQKSAPSGQQKANKQQTPASSGSSTSNKTTLDGYDVKPENWYSTKPYGFRFTNRAGKTISLMLPISPTNLTISTNFATNIIPTLYGTVEEHSDIRYYDIAIEGTTGFAPKYVTDMDRLLISKDDAAIEENTRRHGRRSFEIKSDLNLGGFFSQTLGFVNSIVNKATDLMDQLSGNTNKTKSSVYSKETGYFAFHNLYKFFLEYKHDVSGADGGVGPRKGHPLQFFNYKDNNEYDVAVRSFTLKRSAENPMLYYYSIVLRGYNLRNAGAEKIGDDGIKDRLKDLGLDGIKNSSILGDIKNAARGAKSIAGIISGGSNLVGR